MVVATSALGFAFVALSAIALLRHRWQVRWLAKWAHSASTRLELEPPPPALGADTVRWAAGFRCWSRALKEDLREIRSRRVIAAETGARTQQFHARLRHDLRTPLNAMMGFSDLLLQGIDGPVEERERAVIGSISASSRALHRRVEEVLSDSIGIAITDRPGDPEPPFELNLSERPAVAYPPSPAWMVEVHWRMCLYVMPVLFLALAYLVFSQRWVVLGVCLICSLLGAALCWRAKSESSSVRAQGVALQDGAFERPRSVGELDEALRSFEMRARDSQQRENTAAHFLAQRDRTRNHRIAQSAASLRGPLEDVRRQTAELLQEARLNPKQRDSLFHVLRSANLLNMALEELYLLVDYEGGAVETSPEWVPTVTLLSKSVTRLRHIFGDDVRIEFSVTPGIAPIYVDSTHFLVAFSGLLRFVFKRAERASVQIIARSDSSHVSIHFTEGVERHDTVPGRREQELSVFNSGPKLMRMVMEHHAGQCRYQLEGNLEGWLVFPRQRMRELA